MQTPPVGSHLNASLPTATAAPTTRGWLAWLWASNPQQPLLPLVTKISPYDLAPNEGEGDFCLFTQERMNECGIDAQSLLRQVEDRVMRLLAPAPFTGMTAKAETLISQLILELLGPTENEIPSEIAQLPVASQVKFRVMCAFQIAILYVEHHQVNQARKWWQQGREWLDTEVDLGECNAITLALQYLHRKDPALGETLRGTGEDEKKKYWCIFDQDVMDACAINPESPLHDVENRVMRLLVSAQWPPLDSENEAQFLQLISDLLDGIEQLPNAQVKFRVLCAFQITILYAEYNQFCPAREWWQRGKKLLHEGEGLLSPEEVAKLNIDLEHQYPQLKGSNWGIGALIETAGNIKRGIASRLPWAAQDTSAV